MELISRGARRRRPNSAVCRLAAQVDLVQVQLGQGAVLKAEGSETVPCCARRAPRIEDDVQMIVLAADQRLLAHGIGSPE